jgi:hypothetical protein
LTVLYINPVVMIFPLCQLEDVMSAWKNLVQETNSNTYVKLPSFKKSVGEEKIQDNPYFLQELKECRSLMVEGNKAH